MALTIAADEFIADIAMKALIATGSVSRAVVNLGIGAATEADLLAAQKAAPEKAIEIESLLTFFASSQRRAGPGSGQTDSRRNHERVRVCRQTRHGRSGRARWKGLLTGAVAQKV